MLLCSLWKNGKWIRRVSLYDLLCYDRQNEKKFLPGKGSAVGAFVLSLLLGGVGIFFLCVQPFGKGYDVLAGMICLVFFLFGFFISVPSFLVVQFGNRDSWKYSKNRLVPFRGFTAKIQSTSIVMGVLSVLFMLSISFMGLGTAVCMIVEKNVELSVFDIIILHKGPLQDSSFYDDKLNHSDLIQASCGYGLYSSGKRDFLEVRNKTVSDSGRSSYSLPAEFQYDTCMKQSDYKKLREMLGYQSVELEPSSCYVHCVPALEERIGKLIGQRENLECAGYPFVAGGVFTEPFSQMNTYGNGLNYVIIVPDQAVGQMKIIYSIYAAITGRPLNSHDIQNIMQSGEGLARLQRNVRKTVPGGNAATALIDDADYFSGKWADKEELIHLYAVSICLFYFSFILVIIGAAVLATQVLGDREKKRKQDSILRQLGMQERLISGLNHRQLSQIFLFPLVPSLIVSICLVYAGAEKMHLSAFALPVFNNDLWIIQTLGISLIFFALLYSIYYVAAQISLERS